ncbi:MAG TPA: hypothetical protein VG733_06910 [Chthoniobacteraceae bacterium]|nr:hypothetical protein [Chthoniobacteraceae bacterium]
MNFCKLAMPLLVLAIYAVPALADDDDTINTSPAPAGGTRYGSIVIEY